LLSLVAPLLFAFVATPFLIRGLGVEAYGYYSLVLAVIGSGFTTGLGRVTAKYLPENIAANRSEKLSQLLAAALLITGTAALLEALLLATASPFLISTVLSVPSNATSELQAGLYVACLIGPAMMLSQVFQSALQGLHLFRFYSIVTIAASLLLNLGSVALATNGFSYSHIFFWNLIVTVLSGSVFVLLFRARFSNRSLLAKPGSESIRTVGRFAASIFVYQTITSVFYLFERSFVIRNYGATALTYYSVPLMLGIYLHGLIASFSQVAIPKLNERIERSAGLLTLYRIFTRIAVSFAAFFAVMYFCLGQEFLNIWLGGDFAANSYRLLVIHGVAYALIAFSIICWILAEASHRSGLNALSSTVTCVVGVAVALTFAEMWGAESIALGRLVGAAVVLPLIGFLEAKVFGVVQSSFWLRTLGTISIAVVVVVILETFLSRLLAVTSWPLLVVAGSLLSAVYWVILYFTGYLDIATTRNALSDDQIEHMQT
jgi:O-antigen/teichoic acid export membrane protein